MKDAKWFEEMGLPVPRVLHVTNVGAALRRRIQCRETGIIYGSQGEFAREFGCSILSVYRVLNGKAKSIYGMTLFYVDPPHVGAIKEAKPDGPRRGVIQKKILSILAESDGKILKKTMRKALRDYKDGSYYSAIRRLINADAIADGGAYIILRPFV